MLKNRRFVAADAVLPVLSRLQRRLERRLVLKDGDFCPAELKEQARVKVW